MKKKEMKKKLKLNKKTIADLDRIAMNSIQGGYITTKPHTICDCSGTACDTCDSLEQACE